MFNHYRGIRTSGKCQKYSRLKYNTVPPSKIPDLWKSTTSQAGTFCGANFYPELFLDPGSWKHTEYWPKVPSSWGKLLRWKRGYCLLELLYCLKFFISNLMDFVALILLLNWIESTLNWLKLNNDMIGLCRAAYSWTELIFAHLLNWINTELIYEKNDSIVFVELLYSRICLIVDEVKFIINSSILLFILWNYFETICITV